MIHLRDDIRKMFASERTVADFFALVGDIAKQRHNRCTMRIEREGKGFYLKLHHPVGFGELLKNLLQLRWPDAGAAAEWQALLRLDEIGVPTITGAGYGEQGSFIATQRSFVLTDELPDIVSLEQIAEEKSDIKLTDQLKRRLIRDMASIAALMHQNGVNHRDLYLAHFVLAGEDRKMHVIDLHRVQCRETTPRRWAIKDLAAILFSSLGIEPTLKDRLRFIKHYKGGTYRENRAFWDAVIERAGGMACK